MTNQEHLDLLKQGTDTWNRWRQEHQGIQPDLSRADLRGANLSRANLQGADIYGADLVGAYLNRADLSRANLGITFLIEANLRGADLSRANLSSADLYGANLQEANLSRANLSGANLYGAILTEAKLMGTNLSFAKLNKATLTEADLSSAILLDTVFGDIDLSSVKGFETVTHEGPSTIGIDTIIKSQGKIPEIFLRKAGVPPSIIEAIPSLIGSLKPIDFYSCFISYSSKDQDFAECLYSDLQSKGVRCWFAPHDIRIGDEFRSRIDESIRVHDKLLLILSESSVKSQWVKKEVETAFEKERRRKKLVLFPIKLDETVTRTRQAWAADIRRMRHIGDFTCWKNHDEYQKAFTRLLRDLKAEPPKAG